MSDETYRTRTGRVLSDADIETLSDEAERGYDVSLLLVKKAAGEVAASRKELEQAMRSARETGMSLRKIAFAAGMSHEKARLLLKKQIKE